LYIGSCSGDFYSLDRHQGREIWSYDASLDSNRPNFHGNIVFAGDLVVVGTDAGDRGFLYAFDRATGDLRWRQGAAGGFPSDLATRGSRAYAVTMGGEVRSFDLRTGEVQWVVPGIENERLLKSAIVILGDRVVVSLPSGSVFALEADSGQSAWKTQLPGRLNTPAVTIEDDLYVGDIEGRIHRLSAKDGRLIGVFDAEPPVYGSLLSAGDCLLALWAENTLACLDPRDGSVRWSRRAPSTWSSFQPLIQGELVIVGGESGEIHAFRISDGSTAWTHHLEGEIKGLGAHEGVLYFGTSQGRVYALPFPEVELPPPVDERAGDRARNDESN
jgi:outer membrane protein assembly factor BamB